MKDTTKKISLDDFIIEIEREVSSFKEFWKIANQKTPKSWPMEMSYGDWLEQFLIIIDS